MPINLLPTEQLQSKEVRKVGSGLKMLAAFFGGICLIIAIAGAIMVYTKSKSIETLTTSQNDLKSQVLAQESSEQALVLLRDRLDKLKGIKTKYPNNDSYLSYKTLSDSFPETASVKKLDMQQGAPNFSLSVTDSQILSQVIDLIKQSPLSGSLIKSISFSQAGGFELSIISQ